MEKPGRGRRRPALASSHTSAVRADSPHGLPEARGQGQRPGAGHPGRFDEDHVADARRRPGTARRRCPATGTTGDIPIGMGRRAEPLDDGLRRDLDRRFVSFVLFVVSVFHFRRIPCSTSAGIPTSATASDRMAWGGCCRPVLCGASPALYPYSGLDKSASAV